MFLGSVASAQTDTSDFIYTLNQTYTHDQIIKRYARLNQNFPDKCKLINQGKTDCGKPLHIFIISENGEFNPTKIQEQGKSIMLINNAIHPGEPCGVDASYKLAKGLITENKIPKNTVLLIIPMYNVGGANNRSCCSRANQNGPEMYGFRGNARNLDLNRDFIKMDSENAKRFVEIFQAWQPHLFIDTHASNGADYQYVMTLINTQLDKLAPRLKAYTSEKLLPYLYNEMQKANYPMVPYVHMLGKTPESGIIDYLETPRYSTGYTTLFNCIGFVSETHMWKPYPERVKSTFILLNKLLTFADENTTELVMNKNKSDKDIALNQNFDLDWELDTTKFKLIPFQGYEAKYKTSEVTGLERMYYDRTAPYIKTIKYYNRYKSTLSVEKPKYYILPQSWKEVVLRLELNGINLIPLNNDTTIEVTSYYIKNHDTKNRPYEGHYLHHKVEVEKVKQQLTYFKGDYLIKTGTTKDRFIIETLEPHAVDSYFTWNFFDEILQQKEWFSSYIFEEKAVEILKNNPQLKKEFESKKKIDSEFAKSSWSQLYFIYTHSPYYEKTHNLYPIGRID